MSDPAVFQAATGTSSMALPMTIAVFGTVAITRLLKSSAPTHGLEVISLDQAIV